MTTILLSIGKRAGDQIKISVTNITDAVEVKNAAMDILQDHALAAEAVCLVDAGQFEILEG